MCLERVPRHEREFLFVFRAAVSVAGSLTEFWAEVLPAPYNCCVCGSFAITAMDLRSGAVEDQGRRSGRESWANHARSSGGYLHPRALFRSVRDVYLLFAFAVFMLLNPTYRNRRGDYVVLLLLFLPRFS